MNRRNLLKGFMATPALAIASPAAETTEVFMAGAPQCSECLHIMVIERVTGKERPTMCCANMRCPEYEKKMYIPTMTAEICNEL